MTGSTRAILFARSMRSSMRSIWPSSASTALIPEATGRPSYHPSALLKLYIYGYLNRIQSSRRLEREAGRNLEVIWLLRRLTPDDKTIADFRKDNGAGHQEGVRAVCRAVPRDGPARRRRAWRSTAASSRRSTPATRTSRAGKVERRRAQLEESVARYLAQLDTADRQEPSEALAAKTAHLKEKLAKLESEMAKLAAYEKQMLASPDQQISLTDPDSRSMATSGRGSGVVGYNVQVAVDTEHHLIVTHEVTNSGSDRAQLANMATQAKDVLGVDKLEAVADRGYFSGEEILACDDAGIAVTLPKPMTSGIEGEGPLRQAGLRLSAATRMSIAARPASSSSTTSRARRTGRSCAAIGRMRADTARSSIAARPGHERAHHALGARARAGGRAEASR